jgi:hypothetical protein
MPSPVNLSTVPSKRWTPSQRISTKRSMMIRQASGSSCSARSMEPITSAKMTVTCLRSPSVMWLSRILFARCSGMPDGDSEGATSSRPHALQYRCPPGFSVPQPAHRTAASSDAAQLPQKRASGGLGWAQTGQSIGPPDRLPHSGEPTPAAGCPLEDLREATAPGAGGRITHSGLTARSAAPRARAPSRARSRRPSPSPATRAADAAPRTP